LLRPDDFDFVFEPEPEPEPRLRLVERLRAVEREREREELLRRFRPPPRVRRSDAGISAWATALVSVGI